MNLQKNEWIKIGNIEIEKYLHTEMRKVDEIEIPERCRGMTLSEFFDIWNNHREKFDWGKREGADEWIAQPFEELKKKYPFSNLWFSFPQGRSDLCCRFGVLDGDYGALGARFVREVKK